MLDVRENDEWNDGHVRNAAHGPRRQVADIAAERLREWGYDAVTPMEGRYPDWAEAGYPTQSTE